MVEVLMDADYNGYLTLEYEHDPWMDCDQVDVMTETIKMGRIQVMLSVRSGMR